MKLSIWPTGLHRLDLDAHSAPPELLTASAQTLTKLEVSTSSPYFFNNLAAVAPQLTQLTTLVIHDLVSTAPFTLPASFVAFVAGLPSLATLDLPQLGPHQLEHLLALLPGTQPLRRLVTRVTILSADILADLPQDDVDKWTVDWIPALQRCAQSPVVRGLSEWRASVVRPDACDLEKAEEVEVEEVGQWKAYDERLVFMEQALAQAGVRLELGPLGV